MLSAFFFPLDWAFSLMASALRFGAGGSGAPSAAPQAPLILYEFEGCPFCRIVREQVSALGLTVHIKPCPKGGKRFRPEVKERGGKAQFPFLVDPNVLEGQDVVEMYESADIARYLREKFGNDRRPLIHSAGPLNQLSLAWAAMARFIRGVISRPAAAPDQPLLFFAPERSAGGRLVKEMLCCKELEYVWHTHSKPGKRSPLLKDPNSRREVAGSRAILNYLRQSYPSH